MEIENMAKAARRDRLASQSSLWEQHAHASRLSAPARSRNPSRRRLFDVLATLGAGLLGIAAMFLALALLSTATAQPAAAQTTGVPGCGYLHGSPCTPVDNEYWNIFFSAPSPCDFGLIWDPASLFDPNLPQDCENASRMNVDPDKGWLGWAMNEQRYNIQADTPLNVVTTFGTHNSYSSYKDGFASQLTTDQNLSIWDQLQAGARYIRLDPDYWYNNMRVCHASNTVICELGSPPSGPAIGAIAAAGATYLLGPVGAEMGVITPGRLYAYALIELAQWMDANPQEFVILDVHAGESACGTPSGPTTGPYTCEHNDLLFAPIRQFIGTQKILYPGEAQFNAKNPLPTMRQLMMAGKRLMILSTVPIVDDARQQIAFDRSTYYTETMSAQATYFPACLDDNGDGLWNGGQGKIAYASEDRTSSVTLLAFLTPNYGYLNATQVGQAANCGYGIIAVDFLLNQGLTQLPFPGEVPFYPDMGTDRRREATIWSFDQDDMGTEGPAIMKFNGRWSSDKASATHAYACWKGTSVFDSQWTISQVKGGFYDGLNTKSPVCPTGYSFGAPRTAFENQALFENHPPAEGIWVNYIGSVANLLSAVAPSSIYMEVAARQTPVSPQTQTITVNGPPNATVEVNALAPVYSFLNVPAQITLDANGQQTFEVSLLPGVSKLNAGFYSTNIFINAPLVNTPGASHDLVVSHATVSALLRVIGPDTVSLTTAGSNGTVEEGQAIPFYGQVTNEEPSQMAPSGKLVLNTARFDPNQLVPSFKSLGALPLTVGGSDAVGFSYTRQSFTLAPGKYQVVAEYAGDGLHTAAKSPVLTVTVNHWLRVSPMSYQLAFTQGTPGSNPQQIVVSNDVNVTATTQCADVTPCWLQSTAIAGSGRQTSRDVTVSYTSAASALKPGIYTATITIADGTHAPASVPVSLTESGILTLNPHQLKFLVAPGLSPDPQGVTGVVGQDNVPLTMLASSNRLLSFNNGEVQITPAGLPKPGIYTEWIDLEERQKGNSQPISNNIVRMPVTVEVVPPSRVSTSPSEIVTVDGMDYVSPAQFAWIPGTRHTVSVPQTIPGADGGLVFTHWSDLVATPARQVMAPGTLQDVRSWNAIYVPDLPHFTATARTLDASNPNAVLFQLNLSNSGPGLASQVSLTSISLIGQNGSGSVHLGAIPPGNFSFLSPGQTGGFPLTASWPASVRSITVQANFSCNGGAVTGSVTATIVR